MMSRIDRIDVSGSPAVFATSQVERVQHGRRLLLEARLMHVGNDADDRVHAIDSGDADAVADGRCARPESSRGGSTDHGDARRARGIGPLEHPTLDFGDSKRCENFVRHLRRYREILVAAGTRRPALDREPPGPAGIGQRKVARQRGSAGAGQRADALQDPLVQRGQFRLAVTAFGSFDSKREDVAHLDPRLDMPKTQQTLRHQNRRDDDHDSEGDLEDDESGSASGRG